MYELTIMSLEEMNNHLKRKEPTLVESINTYEQLTKNSKDELVRLRENIAQNDAVINQLKIMETEDDE